LFTLSFEGQPASYWIVTALFYLQISFTAYAQLRLPQEAEAFTHLGFPAYFRVELSWAMLLGVVLLLAPVPARLNEWAYAGFAIDLVSALIAHLSVGGGHWRGLGALVLLLAPPADHASERIAHGLQERGHVGDVVGVARRRVVGEAGFDVTYLRRRSERLAVRPVLPLMVTLNLRQSCITYLINPLRAGLPSFGR
jgi:hypothetical protein